VTRCVRALLLSLGLCLISANAAAAATAWRTQTLGQRHGGLLAVSCVSPTFCMAVGSIEGRKQGVTLAELYNGAGWTVLPTPNVPRATDNELLGVSCSSQNACMAVGFRQNKQGAARTLAEQWNGLAWSIDRAPFVFHSGLASRLLHVADGMHRGRRERVVPRLGRVGAGGALERHELGAAADAKAPAWIRRGAARPVVRFAKRLHSRRRGVRRQARRLLWRRRAFERAWLVDEAEVRRRL
jgi:hypothetical protein